MSEIDYSAVLADLEHRRAELDKAISAIRQIIGAPNESEGTPVPNARAVGSGQAKMPADHAFFGMVIGDAIKAYLQMAKEPKKAVEIARALKAGGLLNTSPNFAATVATTLRRDKTMVQLPDKRWGFASWFGPSAKAKVATSKNGGTEPGEASEANELPSEPEQPS